jgi:hypothetical protein
VIDVVALVGVALIGATVVGTATRVVGCEHPASAVTPASAATTVLIPRLRIPTA